MKQKPNKPLLIFSALIVAFILHTVVKTISIPSEHYLRDRVVRIIGPNGMCTGEQIVAPSGKTYILSAGHCAVLGVNGEYTIQLENGNKIQRKLIKEDDSADLLLIEGIDNLSGINIADKAYKHEHIRTLTHGHNYDTYKTEGELIQVVEEVIPLRPLLTPEDEKSCNLPKNKIITLDTFFGPIKVCLLHGWFLVSTAFIVPGSSGGPVFNDDGKLVGVVSATGEGFSLFVNLNDIHRFLKDF